MRCCWLDCWRPSSTWTTSTWLGPSHSRLLFLFLSVLLSTARPSSQSSVCLFASSCGLDASKTPGAPCRGCSLSPWRRTTSGTAFAMGCGCVHSETQPQFLIGCTSAPRRHSLTCARCWCIWQELETSSPPNMEWPLTSESNSEECFQQMQGSHINLFCDKNKGDWKVTNFSAIFTISIICLMLSNMNKEA